jgi:hypothetical protein
MAPPHFLQCVGGLVLIRSIGSAKSMIVARR